MATALFDGPLGILLPLLHQTADCFEAERLRLPYLLSGKDDTRAVLQSLHPDPRLVERTPHRHGPVICQQERVMSFTFEIGDDAIAQLRRAWHPKGHERYRSHHEDKLRQQIARNLYARNGKACSSRG